MLSLTRRSIVWIATVALLTVPGVAEDAGASQESPTAALPADELTREQLAVRLVEALETEAFQPRDCIPGQEMFDDVPASNPFCPFVEEVARRGIAQGCGDGNFCPAAALTRQQMAVFVSRTLAAAKPRWALVDEDGSIVRQSGGISAQRIEAGIYIVDFGSPVAGRAISVTPSLLHLPSPPLTTAIATPCGGPHPNHPDAAACTVGPNRRRDVAVALGHGNVVEDYPFYITVHPR